MCGYKYKCAPARYEFDVGGGVPAGGANNRGALCGGTVPPACAVWAPVLTVCGRERTCGRRNITHMSILTVIPVAHRTPHVCLHVGFLQRGGVGGIRHNQHHFHRPAPQPTASDHHELFLNHQTIHG